MNTAEMTAKMAAGNGFIAALDQSGGSTPKALKGYGIDESAWSDEAGMYALIHDMRSRIITSPAFTGDKVIAAILFKRGPGVRVIGTPPLDAPMIRSAPTAGKGPAPGSASSRAARSVRSRSTTPAGASSTWS